MKQLVFLLALLSTLSVLAAEDMNRDIFKLESNGMYSVENYKVLDQTVHDEIEFISSHFFAIHDGEIKRAEQIDGLINNMYRLILKMDAQDPLRSDTKENLDELRNWRQALAT